MLTIETQTVQDIETATAFIRECVAKIGIGYHPDTLAADYIDGEGKEVFSSHESTRFDGLTESAFRYIDPYEVALKAVHGFFRQ